MSVTVLRGRRTDATEFRRTAPEILDGKDAAQFLGVSERYLHDNARELGIPYKEIGRTRLYSRSRLVKWVEDDQS